MTELPQEIKDKLEEAVLLWADEALIGKPSILANAMYFSLEKEFLRVASNINKEF